MFNNGQRAKNQAIRYALSMSKRPHFASGGVVGPLLGADGGRTDTLPISVPAGSYVIPADVVSGLPGAQGNSLAGHNALNKLFSSMPLSPDDAPYGATQPKLARGNPRPHEQPAIVGLVRPRGGEAPHDDEAGNVDILAAGGEHVVPPHVVKAIGKGNMKRGHDILDQFVTEVRKRNIDDLKKLPGPVKNGRK